MVRQVPLLRALPRPAVAALRWMRGLLFLFFERFADDFLDVECAGFNGVEDRLVYGLGVVLGNLGQDLLNLFWRVTLVFEPSDQLGVAGVVGHDACIG